MSAPAENTQADAQAEVLAAVKSLTAILEMQCALLEQIAKNTNRTSEFLVATVNVGESFDDSPD